MSYRIDARLIGGRPTLEILDADSGALRMAWISPESDLPSDTDSSVRELFRDLFLLCTADRLRERARALKLGDR